MWWNCRPASLMKYLSNAVVIKAIPHHSNKRTGAGPLRC